MADRDQPGLARRIQQLSESGDYEGFNAIAGALLRCKEFDVTAIDVIKRDTEFKNRITEICHDRSERKRVAVAGEAEASAIAFW